MYDCLLILPAFCSHTGLPFNGVVTQAAREKVRDKGMHTRSSSDAKLELACCLATLTNQHAVMAVDIVCHLQADHRDCR